MGFYLLIFFLNFLSLYFEEFKSRIKFLKNHDSSIFQKTFEKYVNNIEEDSILIFSIKLETLYFINDIGIDLFKIDPKLCLLKKMEACFKELGNIIHFEDKINEYYEKKTIVTSILKKIKDKVYEHEEMIKKNKNLIKSKKNKNYFQKFFSNLTDFSLLDKVIYYIKIKLKNSIHFFNFQIFKKLKF